jgi:gamma-glutamylputrescine oxidase
MSGEAPVESYFEASVARAPAFPALEGAVAADVCVVGGGYSGLAVALELAERGYEVVLLESERLGWGASGRNGGQICTAFASGMGAIESALGREDARRLFDLAEEAKEIIRQRVRDHAIDCELAWGYFHGAHKAHQLGDLARMQAAWAGDYGYDGTTLATGSEAVGAYVRTAAYAGGLFDPGAGHLHPLAYCLGLGRAAAAAGVRIFEGSRVVSIEQGEKVELTTPGGRVRAQFAVLCANAYLGNLVPALRSRIMPVGTYIAATAPLGAARARRLIPGNAAIADCNFVLNYYRLSADHRMLFGGRVSYSTLMPPNLLRQLRGKMREVFPELAEVRFDYTWGGYVAITIARTPHIGRLGASLYFAQGFSGQGVALTGIAGRVIAEMIAGQAERFDLMARLPHRPFPGGRLLRTPILALAMLWYRLRDLL